MSSLRTKFPRVVKVAENRKLRKTLRVSRGVAVVFAAVGAGRALGVMEVVKDPKEYENKMLLSTLKANNVNVFVGVNATDDLEEKTLFQRLRGSRAPLVPMVMSINEQTWGRHVVSSDFPVWQSARHCVRVFSRVQAEAHHVAAARVAYLRRYKKLPDRHGFKHIDDTIPWEKFGLEDFVDTSDDDLQHWETMERMLAQKWRIIVTDELTPNAFVSPMLPRKVFTNVGLLELFCKNDDQLAAILGHELSHVMLRHSESSLELDFAQQLVTFMLISLFDFTGVFTFAFEVGMFATNIGQWMPSYFSREHEREADSLGAYLAAAACYDPKAMKVAFENMVDVEQKMTGGHIDAHMLSTHPASTERVENASVRADQYLNQMYEKCKRDGECPVKQQWNSVLSPEMAKSLQDRMRGLKNGGVERSE